MTLLELQRRMAEDVCRPLTPEFRMQPRTEDGESLDGIAASYIRPNDRLSSFERLEIYNRQYWFRVISAVSEDFPALSAVLGSKQFDALILAYLRNHPSSSWTLRDLGRKLPEFLEGHAEFGGRRHRLAVDVARLEWAYVDAFDSRYLEPLSPDDARALGPESKVLLQPHLQLLALAYPVDDLVLGVRRDTPEVDIVSNAASRRATRTRVKLPPMRRQEIFLAVHRYENSVYYRRIAKEDLALLSALRAGRSIAAAVSEAFAQTRLSGEAQLKLVERSFTLASEFGWLCPDGGHEWNGQ